MENIELKEKSAGVLCHISSLPNKYGIGSLGKEAYEFVDFLKKARCKYWQVLPLAQTGFGDSPYQSVCANSGNPYFIDLETLCEEGLLSPDELESARTDEDKVNYGKLYNERYSLLRKAFSRFDIEDVGFVKFIEGGEYDDYALFMSLKSIYSGSFCDFPDAIKYREQLALSDFKDAMYKREYCFWQFLQYEFGKQWKKLKNYANANGVKIIGDVPLYVAYDSADVWSHPKLFKLDSELKPTEVAGVPPDYFSKTGQLWGNPLYNWKALAAENYDWWVRRVQKAAELFDVIRIDHFRGLDRYYAVPEGSKTAETGEWQVGPKEELFKQISSRLGDVQIIAEDLGVVDDGVKRLMKNTGFPGMKILMFAFDGTKDNPYLPANMEENSVVYTGTHDNDTALGFLKNQDRFQFRALKKQLRAALESECVVYPFSSQIQTVQAMCVCALASPAKLAILPVQDLLQLDNSCRMNRPSTNGGNWRFRLTSLPSCSHAAWLRKYIEKFHRN